MLTKQIEDPQVIIGRVRSHVDCELALRKREGCRRRKGDEWGHMLATHGWEVARLEMGSERGRDADHG